MSIAEASAPSLRAEHTDRIPVVVQILSVIGFGVFSIVAVSLAFAENWIAGLALALCLLASGQAAALLVAETK